MYYTGPLAGHLDFENFLFLDEVWKIAVEGTFIFLLVLFGLVWLSCF